MRISDWSSDVCSSDLVEDADDIGRLVVDDALALAVPKNGDGDPARVLRIVTGVALMEVVEFVQRIAAGAGGLVEGPAVFGHQPADHGHVDQRLEPLELAVDQRAMRPRTGKRNREMIANGLGQEATLRSEKRREGKEGGRTGRIRGW